MKRMKRTGIYKASNVTFDPLRMEAISYGWWKFVERIGGEIVFNCYSYSPSTCRHQSKVLALLGYDRELTRIESPEGLQAIESAIPYYRGSIDALYERINAKGTRREKNEKRWQEIGFMQGKIETVNRLIEAKRSA